MILDIGCGTGEYEAQSFHRGQINIDVIRPTQKKNFQTSC